MTETPKATEYGTANGHGPTVIKARNNFLPEIQSLLPRASQADVEAFVDHMIECRYFSDVFFAAWSFEEGHGDE